MHQRILWASCFYQNISHVFIFCYLKCDLYSLVTYTMQFTSSKQSMFKGSQLLVVVPQWRGLYAALGLAFCWWWTGSHRQWHETYNRQQTQNAHTVRSQNNWPFLCPSSYVHSLCRCQFVHSVEIMNNVWKICILISNRSVSKYMSTSIWITYSECKSKARKTKRAKLR